MPFATLPDAAMRAAPSADAATLLRTGGTGARLVADQRGCSRRSAGWLANGGSRSSPERRAGAGGGWGPGRLQAGSKMARAVIPSMLRAGSGRIVTVTTSLGTMLREGYVLYGASKAAAEAATAVMAADLAGTGVTANVLVPGGVTDTRIVPDAAVADRSRLLRPEIMAPPLLWLVSDAAAGVTGRRFLAVHWDSSLPPSQAAGKCGASIARQSIATIA